MIDDASIAGDVYHVYTPGLAPSEIQAVRTFLFSRIVFPLDL